MSTTGEMSDSLGRSLLFRLDDHRARRDRALLSHPLGARTVEPAMAPAPVVQQPEHGKARRTAEVIGADRVLRATAAPSSIQLGSVVFFRGTNVQTYSYSDIHLGLGAGG